MALDAHAEGDDVNDEEFVRQHWKEVVVSRNSGLVNVRGDGPRFDLNITPQRDDSYGDLGRGLSYSDFGYYEEKVWAKARAFTEARLEQIRQVEEEIAYVRRWHRGPHPVWTRILAREQATLAELRIGMKVTA